jgi:hypothetical protein
MYNAINADRRIRKNILIVEKYIDRKGRVNLYVINPFSIKGGLNHSIGVETTFPDLI